MSDDSIRCEKCNQVLTVGAYPFCPHELSGRTNVIDDTLPGGARWMWNLGDEGVWVETKTQFKEELAKRGLVHSERKNYNKDDKSPYATRTRLRPGARDPFLHKASK